MRMIENDGFTVHESRCEHSSTQNTPRANTQMHRCRLLSRGAFDRSFTHVHPILCCCDQIKSNGVAQIILVKEGQ